MVLRIMSSTSCIGGLCAECDGRGPPSGGGTHGSGDPACQRAPVSNCEEQQSGAHSFQHPPAFPSYHACQQEEQAPHRYLPPQHHSLHLPTATQGFWNTCICICVLDMMQRLLISLCEKHILLHRSFTIGNKNWKMEVKYFV